MNHIADRIRTAQDKDGMLRRALERIIQLYTDKSHFVYELLQNAEDAEAHSIRFIQYPDRLEVFHDGKPFTTANLQGLCDIGKSDKVDNLNQIGEFGVGFKSVFGICDTVRLFSNPQNYRNSNIGDATPFAIEIRDFTRPEAIPEEELPKSFTTRFVFPYTVGYTFSGFSSVDDLNRTLSKKLQNLGITTLLFMKNLGLIGYEIKTEGEPVKGEYLLEKTVINDHCLLVSALGTSAQKTNKNNNEQKDEEISYLKFSRKISKYEQRTVDIAFPIRVNKDRSYECIKAPSPYVSVYFPTETESKLSFIVQGPYRTTPNRSSIPSEDYDNKYLASETATLLRASLFELKMMGKLNMSFIKALPLSEEPFSMFDLFLPLHIILKEVFLRYEIIPSKSGKYVYAKNAKIARQEKLATVLNDQLLTQLINDGESYCWLPTYLTETNRTYKHVLEFMTSALDIPVIRPEDLRGFFASNPKFLPAQSTDWIVDLYGIFEAIPGSFSKSRFESNMTTANIIRTTTGEFVAPFRKEGKGYIPNVFLPSPNIRNADINYVDNVLYNRCRHFFDDIIQIQKPNEYEYVIKAIESRYESGRVNADEQHIEDVKALVKYGKREEYEDEIARIIKNLFTIKCIDGVMRNTYSFRVFLPISNDGVNLEGYYRNINKHVSFADVDFYANHGISTAMLLALGARESILVGENIENGTYESGSAGRQPTWWTSGDFRWKLSIDSLREVLVYISKNPKAKDSILKSQAIVKILVANEKRICGDVHIGGAYVPNKYDEPCEMIHILRGEGLWDRLAGWNGKWIYTESGELVSPKSISKRDISTAIYGTIRPDSVIFRLLEFKKTEADEVEELKKTVPKDKLEAYFESELRQRYGISTSELIERYGTSRQYDTSEEETALPFPTLNVRSWDALRKHAAEMLIYADPVRYEARVRSIRTSSRSGEAKAYLSNMYRHDGNNRFKFACQLCHETCSQFEATEIFLHPETELDPINLCLCPNCAAAYRRMRSNPNIMDIVRKAFMSKKETDIENEDYIVVPIDDDDSLWFTQTHFAEIRELLRLAEEVKKPAPKNETTTKPSTKENAESTLSVYKKYIGKTISRKDGFVGTIKDVSINGKNAVMTVLVIGGRDTGKETKIMLSFLLTHKDVYTVSDK